MPEFGNPMRCDLHHCRPIVILNQRSAKAGNYVAYSNIIWVPKTRDSPMKLGSPSCYAGDGHRIQYVALFLSLRCFSCIYLHFQFQTPQRHVPVSPYYRPKCACTGPLRSCALCRAHRHVHPAAAPARSTSATNRGFRLNWSPHSARSSLLLGPDLHLLSKRYIAFSPVFAASCLGPHVAPHTS